MSLKIRLTRGGAKKRPYYRIVVADARSPRDGRFIEKIGSYDPMKAKDSPERVVLDVEKAKEWLAKGAQPTDRVLRFLDAAGLAKRPARNNPERPSPARRPRSAPEPRPRSRRSRRSRGVMRPQARDAVRHGRACPDHPRLRWSRPEFKSWMLATGASMTAAPLLEEGAHGR